MKNFILGAYLVGQIVFASHAFASDTALESLYQCTLKQTIEPHPGFPETIYQVFTIYGPLPDAGTPPSAFPAMVTTLQTFHPESDLSVPDGLVTGTIRYGTKTMMNVPLSAVFSLNLNINGYVQTGTWTINTDGLTASTVEVKSNDSNIQIPLSDMSCVRVSHQKESIGAHN